MLQPHEHIARAHPGKSGSAYGSDRDFRSKRFPPGAAFVIALLVAPFAWGGIIWAVMAVVR